MKRFVVACALLGCVVPTPSARTGGPTMLIGAAEDAVLTVVYTERNGRIRIISARQATKHEQDDYFIEND